jgi:hypothetical protein
VRVSLGREIAGWGAVDYSRRIQIPGPLTHGNTLIERSIWSLLTGSYGTAASLVISILEELPIIIAAIVRDP